MKSELFFRTQTQGTPLEWLPDAAGIENEVITIYPDQPRETWDGFGAALTGASGSVYARMTQAQRQQMMETYFSPRQMGYNRVRIHLDSCDFCPEMYEADSDEQDCLLEKFDFSRTEALILPMLRDAEAAAGQKLRLMLSPWSPPAYMKSNGQRCQGGSLKPEYYDRWRNIFADTLRNFKSGAFLWSESACKMSPKPCRPGIPVCTRHSRKNCFCRSCTVPCFVTGCRMSRCSSGTTTRNGRLSVPPVSWTRSRAPW